tara:strand:- start:111 stop:308 length:198 start_codon:yes stop_codon:yes gene_type:complete
MDKWGDEWTDSSEGQARPSELLLQRCLTAPIVLGEAKQETVEPQRTNSNESQAKPGLSSHWRLTS